MCRYERRNWGTAGYCVVIQYVEAEVTVSENDEQLRSYRKEQCIIYHAIRTCPRRTATLFLAHGAKSYAGPCRNRSVGVLRQGLKSSGKALRVAGIVTRCRALPLDAFGHAGGHLFLIPGDHPQRSVRYT